MREPVVLPPPEPVLAEAVAWLRRLCKPSITTQALEDFYAWRRRDPVRRAAYDDISARLFDAVLGRAPEPGA
jgi:ferric-dicitrate binding protein FerR (iron transport regulator)